MQHYKDCPAVLESYLRYLTMVCNKAKSTVIMRYVDLRGFFQFLRTRGEYEPTAAELATGEVLVAGMQVDAVAEVTEDDIYDYLDYLSHERRISEITIYRKKLPSLRRFYDYLMRHQEEFGICLNVNPVGKITAPTEATRPARCLTPSEISRLLKAVAGETALRDTAMILLILTTGLNISELAKARYTDYHEDLLLVAGRKVHLTEGCQEAIEEYICQFRNPVEQYLKDNTLFITHNYLRRLTARGIQKALQKHFDRAGVDGTARDLRHTAVMELLKNARNECERAYIAGYLGYTNADHVSRLPLPKPPQDDPMVDLVQNTWLADLGKN